MLRRSGQVWPNPSEIELSIGRSWPKLETESGHTWPIWAKVARSTNSSDAGHILPKIGRLGPELTELDHPRVRNPGKLVEVGQIRAEIGPSLG